MTRLLARNWSTYTLTALFIATLTSLSSAADSANLREHFVNPPKQYSTGPLWVWNDLITEEQVKSTLADLAGQRVKQVWIHPRPGLMTPYLGKEWFHMWKVALSEAERLDMNVWIYDENSYPSGFAGGLVPEAMPESRGQGLHFTETKTIGVLEDDVYAVFRMTTDSFENVTTQARSGAAMPEALYLIATKKLAPSVGWFGGKYYVDLIKPGVTKKFIEVTHGAYKREVGEHFGGRIPGIFTDEPHLSPTRGLHWSDEFAVEFQNRWGYDPIEHLPCLERPVGDWKRVRHNYHQLLLELFVDRWAKPCYEYCEKNNLEFTGHYWEHGWPKASRGPDNMAMYAWHQRPAIDNLFNNYTEGVHGQFGNSRTVRELASVANQLGRKRTLCETYGAGGWSLRLEDMKRIGDWVYVLGVNTLNEHLSFVTIRGARKRDHPQSFSYHAPWWESYHKMAAYFTRLSLALSEGEQIHHLLLLEPTTSAWMYQPDPSSEPQLETIGNSFQEMIVRLERVQAEYDIGSEGIIGDQGALEANENGVSFIVGKRKYDTVVLPPFTENLNRKTMQLLEEFVAQGGTVYCCGVPPSRVDGQISDRGTKLASSTSWKQTSVDAAIEAMRLQPRDGMTIKRSDNDEGILFHHRRQLDDGEILFLVNTSIDSPSTGTIRSRAKSVEKWNLENGKVSSYLSTASSDGVIFNYSLPPCGSLLVFLSRESKTPSKANNKEFQEITPNGPPTTRRLEPNVLTLDYVDVTAGGETSQDIYFFQAAQFAFKKNGLEGNPWETAVQFRDELITKKFLPESGLKAAYRFTIEQQIPNPLHLVVERPDLYSVTCNGKAVAAEPGDWWLDKSFGKIDISKAAKVGENVVTIQASPLSIYHELESAYVLGDFSLQAKDSGFTIVPPQPLQMSQASWNEQGHPFYSSGVAYTETFDVPKPSGEYIVALSNWYGSVAKVIVNGQVAGYIGYRPWECEVSNWIKPGENQIEVVIIGTLRNTLGPHHFGPLSGEVRPYMFQKAPKNGPPAGKDYSVLDYGLFEPFTLKCSVE